MRCLARIQTELLRVFVRNGINSELIEIGPGEAHHLKAPLALQGQQTADCVR